MKRPDFLMHGLFAAAAVLSAAATLVIFAFMAVLGLPVLADGHFWQVVSGPWAPQHNSYGIAPMIVGTLSVSLLGLAIAVPLSLGCAAFVQVTAPRGAARILHVLIRLMTGIPTVIYGFVGIFVLVPLVRELFGRGSGLCMLSAAVMLAVLVAPTMILFFVDGLANVPRTYCRAAAALGASPVQRLVYVLIPHAWRNILAGIVLGFGRALGDTMIALMLAGNAVAMPESVLDSTRTLTAHIALIIAADFDSLEFRTLFICGLMLYLFTSLGVVVVRRTAGRQAQTP